MLDNVTAVTLRGNTDDETLTLLQREGGIVIVHVDNTQEISPPKYSDELFGVSMAEAVAEAKKLGWNTVGGPPVRPRKEPPALPPITPSLPRPHFTKRDGPKYDPLKTKKVPVVKEKKQEAFDANHIPGPGDWRSFMEKFNEV